MTDKFIPVSKEEFRQWIAAYPRPLKGGMDGTYDPPLCYYLDEALPGSRNAKIVAYYSAAWGPDSPEHGYDVLVEIPTVTAPAPVAAPSKRQDDGYVTWDAPAAMTTYYYSALHGPDDPEPDYQALNNFLKS